MTRTTTRTYFVPIERGNLPADDPHRWLILPVDATDPGAATVEARQTADAIVRRPFRATIWAAVLDCPSFEHMQLLRESYDVAFGHGKRGREAVKTRVAGHA